MQAVYPLLGKKERDARGGRATVAEGYTKRGAWPADRGAPGRGVPRMPGRKGALPPREMPRPSPGPRRRWLRRLAADRHDSRQQSGAAGAGSREHSHIRPSAHPPIRPSALPLYRFIALSLYRPPALPERRPGAALRNPSANPQIRRFAHPPIRTSAHSPSPPYRFQRPSSPRCNSVIIHRTAVGPATRQGVSSCGFGGVEWRFRTCAPCANTT